MNPIAHIHMKQPRLTKEGFVAGGAAAVAVAVRIVGGYEKAWWLREWVGVLVFMSAGVS